MREAVRLNLDRLMVPVDVVINPKKVVMTAEFSRIVEEVQKAFEAVAKRSDANKDESAAGPDGVQQRCHAGRGRSGGKRQSPKQGGVA
jgi:hypothetical protein